MQQAPASSAPTTTAYLAHALALSRAAFVPVAVAMAASAIAQRPTSAPQHQPEPQGGQHEGQQQEGGAVAVERL